MHSTGTTLVRRTSMERPANWSRYSRQTSGNSSTSALIRWLGTMSPSSLNQNREISVRILPLPGTGSAMTTS